MFSDQKKTKSSSDHHEQNKLASGTVITGDIAGKGCFRIEGTLEGSIKTPGKVVVSETGVINGNIECENADIEGKITGKVVVNKVLCLRSSAIIEGEVITGKLAVEPGANFNATCEMASGVKPLKKENEKKSA